MAYRKSEPKSSFNPEHAAYEPPAVVYEAALEARAGSPTGILPLLDLTDPAGLGQK